MEKHSGRPGRMAVVMGVALVFLLGLGVGLGALYFLNHPADKRAEGAEGPPEGPVAGASEVVTALGRIEPDGGVVSLGAAAPDLIQEFSPGVEEGSWVKAGDPLVKLESFTDRKFELDLLRQQQTEAKERLESIKQSGNAQVKLDRMRLKTVEKFDPLDLEMQKKKVKVLEQQVQEAEKTLDRYQKLRGKSFSDQEVERQQLLVDQARAELQAAVNALAKMKDGQQVEQARAQLEATEAALKRSLSEIPTESLALKIKAAEWQRDHRSVLRAPAAGKVLKVFGTPGELVGPQRPILQLADTRKMAVIAEVYVTDIRRVRVGQIARITSRALGNREGGTGEEAPLTGKVVRIGDMVGRNQIYDVDPAANVDRRVVEVKILLDRPEPAAEFIHHQVLVRILPAAGGVGRP